MRGSSQTVPGNLAVSIRLRLTAFRPLALCRSCDCHRGCFAGLTQGPSRRFPRFAPGWAFAGWDAVLPAELWGQQPSAGHPLTVLQVAAQSPKSRHLFCKGRASGKRLIGIHSYYLNIYYKQRDFQLNQNCVLLRRKGVKIMEELLLEKMARLYERQLLADDSEWAEIQKNCEKVRQNFMERYQSDEEICLQAIDLIDTSTQVSAYREHLRFSICVCLGMELMALRDAVYAM